MTKCHGRSSHVMMLFGYQYVCNRYWVRKGLVDIFPANKPGRQNARKLVYAGTFAAGDTDICVTDRHLKIGKDSKCKFRENVSQITFSGKVATASGQPVLYVTERCVFRLTAEGLELIEVAPGVDIERDIIARLPFRPLMREVQIMDPRLFAEGTMGLRERLLELPLGEPISYDPPRNTLLLTF